MLHKLWEYKKIRFLCVGSFNSLCDLAMLNLLVFVVHTPVWAANIFSVSIGISLSYFLNHFIVFRHHHDPNFKQFAKFFMITGTSVIVLQTLVIYATRPVYAQIIDYTHVLNLVRIENKISLNLAKITAILVGMVWNYLFYSRVIFKNKTPNQEVEDITGLV